MRPPVGVRVRDAAACGRARARCSHLAPFSAAAASPRRRRAHGFAGRCLAGSAGRLSQGQPGVNKQLAGAAAQPQVGALTGRGVTG